MSSQPVTKAVTRGQVNITKGRELHNAIAMGRQKLNDREEREKVEKALARQAVRAQIVDRQDAVRQALPAYLRSYIQFVTSPEAADLVANQGPDETVKLIIPHLAPIEMDLKYDYQAKQWNVGGNNGRHYSVPSLTGSEFTGPEWMFHDLFFTTDLEIALAIAAQRGEDFEALSGAHRLHLEPQYEDFDD